VSVGVCAVVVLTVLLARIATQVITPVVASLAPFSITVIGSGLIGVGLTCSLNATTPAASVTFVNESLIVCSFGALPPSTYVVSLANLGLPVVGPDNTLTVFDSRISIGTVSLCMLCSHPR
jgi:hypothetical protein